MNKSNKYYLKEGKLELSILDDEEDEKEQIVQTRKRRDLLHQSEAKRTKKRRRVERTVEQPELTVSKDVYNTLHTMGKFLTKPECGEIEQKSMVGTKESRISSNKKVKEIVEDEETVKNLASTKQPIYKPALKEQVPLDYGMGILEQKTIDHLVEAFFEEMDEDLADHPNLEALKKHIEKQINAVRSGKQVF